MSIRRVWIWISTKPASLKYWRVSSGVGGVIFLLSNTFPTYSWNCHLEYMYWVTMNLFQDGIRRYIIRIATKYVAMDLGTLSPSNPWFEKAKDIPHKLWPIIFCNAHVKKPSIQQILKRGKLQRVALPSLYHIHTVLFKRRKVLSQISHHELAIWRDPIRMNRRQIQPNHLAHRELISYLHGPGTYHESQRCLLAPKGFRSPEPVPTSNICVGVLLIGTRTLSLYRWRTTSWSASKRRCSSSSQGKIYGLLGFPWYLAHQHHYIFRPTSVHYVLEEGSSCSQHFPFHLRLP